jgi:hypothetical protein
MIIQLFIFMYNEIIFIYMKKIELLLLIFIFYSILPCKTQEKYMLNDKNLLKYEFDSTIKNELNFVFDSIKTKVLTQRYKKSDIDLCDITYFEFESENDAIKSMSYLSNSYSIPFIFGSPTGELLGDASWISIDKSVFIFQKNEIGIKIFKPINNINDDLLNFQCISNKILYNIDSIKKINYSLDHYISDYSNQIKKSENILSKYNFNIYKIEDSRWIFTKDSIIYGKKIQFRNENSLICIDIADCINDSSTNRVIKFRSETTMSPTYDLNDYESLKKVIKTNKASDGSSYLSIVGNKGVLAVQIYCYYLSNINIKNEILCDILRAYDQ